MSLSERIVNPDDRKIGLCGPFVGKLNEFGQNEPTFSFLDCVQDMLDDGETLSELGLDPDQVRDLAVQIMGRNPQSQDREVIDKSIVSFSLYGRCC